MKFIDFLVYTDRKYDKFWDVVFIIQGFVMATILINVSYNTPLDYIIWPINAFVIAFIIGLFHGLVIIVMFFLLVFVLMAVFIMNFTTISEYLWGSTSLTILLFTIMAYACIQLSGWIGNWAMERHFILLDIKEEWNEFKNRRK